MAEQKAQRREQILAAARDLITERGYREVTMRAIAGRCGVSIPTLYNLCGDRRTLLFEAVSSHLTGVLGNISAAASKRGHRKVVAVAEACAVAMCQRPDYHRTMMGVLAGGDGAYELSANLSRMLASEIQVGIDEMRAAAELASWADPAALSHAVAGQIVATASEWASGSLDDENLRSAMVYGVSIALLGVAEGKATAAVRRLAEGSQGDALARIPEPDLSELTDTSRTA